MAKKKPEQRPEPTAYERHKERARSRQADISASGRDIAPLPAIANPRRRRAAGKGLEAFCLTYAPGVFFLPFSADHRKVIAKLETAVRDGGQFGVAMPRESGKTSLCLFAALWAVLYGYRKFVVLIGANESKAGQLLEDVQEILQGSPDLIADFPESVYPFSLIGNTPQKARGQLHDGKLTDISIKEGRIQFPKIPKSKASGARLVITGLTGGGIRGLHKIGPDGSWDRPDLVILDDPQTDASARSREQNRVIVKLISGAVLGMGGAHGKRIACVMPCTVIEPGDAVEQMLELPKWKAERCQRMYSFPANTKLWDEYAKLRSEDFLAEKAGQENPHKARAFYDANRAAMDEGAVVAWPEQFNDDELSAVQHAMNLMIDDPESFWAEHQNQPRPRATEGNTIVLDPRAIAAKLTHLPLCVVPMEATRLTAFIDVQSNVLAYAVCAWDERFSGSVILYGHWPKQGRSYFRRSEVSPSFAEAYPGYSLEAAIYKALADLTDMLLGRHYLRDQTGEPLRIEKCLIDTGYNEQAVTQFCRQTPFGSVVLASKGIGITAAKVPMSEWPKRDGETRGLNYVVRMTGKGRAARIDTNFWKTFVALRWQTPFGSPGCLALYGDRPADHQMFADHCAAETAVEKPGLGRTVHEWFLQPSRENEWLDCVVGCAAGAAIAGLKWSPAHSSPGSSAPRPAPAKPADRSPERTRRRAANPI